MLEERAPPSCGIAGIHSGSRSDVVHTASGRIVQVGVPCMNIERLTVVFDRLAGGRLIALVVVVVLHHVDAGLFYDLIEILHPRSPSAQGGRGEERAMVCCPLSSLVLDQPLEGEIEIYRNAVAARALSLIFDGRTHLNVCAQERNAFTASDQK